MSRASLILLSVLLSASWTVLGQDDADPWQVRLAHGCVPLAVTSPVVDGNDGDLAWRAPATRVGLLAPASAASGELQVACDERYVYLLVHLNTPLWASGDPLVRNEEGTVSADHLKIRFGPAPWLRRRIVVSSEGRMRDGAWNGWDWDSLWDSGMVAAQEITEDGTMVEIALPRADVAASCLQSPAGMSLQLIRRFAGETAMLDLGRGAGVVLGADATVTTIAVRPMPEGRALARVGVLSWLGPDAEAAVALRPSALGEETEPIRVSLDVRAAGLSSCVIPLQSMMVRADLSLQVRGQSSQSWPVFRPWRKMRDDNQVMLEACRAVRVANGSGAMHHYEDALLSGLPARIDKVIADWFAADVSGVRPAGVPEDISFTAPQLPQETFQLLEEGYDIQGAPEWAVLAENAAKSAFWRPVYRGALATGGLLPIRSRPDAKIKSLSAAEVARRFSAWRKHLRTLPDRSAGSSHPAWQPDLAGVRTRALLQTARVTANDHGAHSILSECVAEAIRTHRLVKDTLARDLGATPFRPDLCGLLALNAMDLPMFLARDAELADLQTLAERQFAAHVHEDGAGRLPGTDELIACRTVLQLADLAGSGEIQKDTHARMLAMLRYLSERVLPTVRVPQFGAGKRVPDTGMLAEWAERLFPGEADLARFRPEGLVAVPLVDSVPERSNAPEYGGLYVSRSAGGRIALAVMAPAAGEMPDSSAALVFGALALSTETRDLLLEPDAARLANSSPVMVDDAGPLPYSLPVPGVPLPHRWMTSDACDVLDIWWRALPRAAGESGCRRTVLVAKGEPARTYVYVCDSIRYETNGHRLVQTLPLADDARAYVGFALPDARQQLRLDGEGDANRCVRIEQELTAVDAAELIIQPRDTPFAPRPNEAALVTNVQRLGDRLATGGGVLRVTLEEGAQDFILSDPNGAGLSGTFGSHEARLDGRLALFRFTPRGIGEIACSGVRDVSFTNGSTWTLSFGKPVDAAVEIRKDGSWSVRLESAAVDAVALEVEVTGPGRPDGTARVLLTPGKATVFRLL